MTFFSASSSSSSSVCFVRCRCCFNVFLCIYTIAHCLSPNLQHNKYAYYIFHAPPANICWVFCVNGVTSFFILCLSFSLTLKCIYDITFWLFNCLYSITPMYPCVWRDEHEKNERIIQLWTKWEKRETRARERDIEPPTIMIVHLSNIIFADFVRKPNEYNLQF